MQSFFIDREVLGGPGHACEVLGFKMHVPTVLKHGVRSEAGWKLRVFWDERKSQNIAYLV